MGFTEPLSLETLGMFGIMGQFRRLEDADKSKVSLSDFVKVTLNSSNESIENINVNHRILDFDGELAYLQLDLDGLQRNLDQSQAILHLSDFDGLNLSIDDSDGRLTSISGDHIKTDQSADFKIASLIDRQTAGLVKTLSTILLSILGVSLTITFSLAMFRGSLATTWLCINTLQVLAHVPMIAHKLPGNSHYFILDLLSFVRLNLDSFNSSVDDLHDKMMEYELLSGDDLYDSKLHNLGYRYSFAHNMLLFGCALLVLCIVWLFVTVLERTISLCCYS